MKHEDSLFARIFEWFFDKSFDTILKLYKISCKDGIEIRKHTKK